MPCAVKYDDDRTGACALAAAVPALAHMNTAATAALPHRFHPTVRTSWPFDP
jgi:hypothetical protein